MKDFLRFLVYGSLFAVPFITLYVPNDYFFPFITGKNFAFRILVEIAFLAWIVLALSDVKYRPKFSWVLSSFSVLVVVMFFANLFGQHPGTGFWSNFERMDGYVTLIHVFLYMTVLGSMLTTKQAWGWYLHATLLVATITAFYGIAQYTGVVEGAEGRRIESYLGNAAYLSIYMFFHIFITFWLFVESKVNLYRVIYVLLACMFIYALLNSGTRGTVLGFGAGLGVMVAYIMFFGAKYQVFRRYAIGGFIFLMLGVGMFVLGKDSDFIQNNANLARVANIDLASDLKVRGTIWGMALEGVKERPMLGWGQGNFNYIFNEKYDPFLFNQEQWFDRAHNIVMDWLVAGGILGLIAYFSIFAACIYYLVVVPLLRKDDQTFTVLERGVLLGILAGYLTHNLVVFDNIVSYIFFAVILALIHSRVGEVVPEFQAKKIDDALVQQFVAPVVAVLLVALIYTLHIPGMQAAGDIIDGYRTTTPELRLEHFKLALSRDSFGHQEITEQIAQQAMSFVGDAQVSEETRQAFVTLAESELMKLEKDKPGDARVHVFFSSFYRALGDNDKALEQIKLARELSPKKPSILMQEGVIYYIQGDLEASRDIFAQTLSLDERNDEARQYYAALLFKTEAPDEARALFTDPETLKRAATNNFLVQTVTETTKDFEFLIPLFVERLAQAPEVEQNWVSLAFLYYQNEEFEKAADLLEEAAIARPPFATKARCYSANIRAGQSPMEGC